MEAWVGRPAPSVTRALAYVSGLIDTRLAKPGDSLPPAAVIADRIGVNRPAVLEAFEQLKVEGRLAVVKGRGGVMVVDPGPEGQARRRAWVVKHEQTIREMSLLREVIEPAIAERLAKRGLSTAELARLKALVAQHEAEDDDSESRQLDTRFHTSLAELLAVPILIEMLQLCRRWVTPTFDVIDWPSTRLEEARKHHRALLDAIAAADAEGAAAIALEHVASTSRYLEATLRNLHSDAGLASEATTRQ